MGEKYVGMYSRKCELHHGIILMTGFSEYGEIFPRFEDENVVLVFQ